MSSLKPVQYHLEIYEPGGDAEVLVSLSASQPFGRISVGDRIDPRAWDGSTVADRLEVTGVEHAVWDGGGHIVHKVLIFTRTMALQADFDIDTTKYV